jgi:hypothetical protein
MTEGLGAACGVPSSAFECGNWVDQEVAGCDFEDARLGTRIRKLLEQISGAMGHSIPFACQDWANAKAAYRFFANDRVSEAHILGGHFSVDAGSYRRHRRCDPSPARHDGVLLSKGEAGSDRVDLQGQ